VPLLMFPPKLAGADSSSTSDSKNVLSNIKGLFQLQQFSYYDSESLLEFTV